MASFAESVVEDATLAWLESLGYAVKHGPEIAPGELFAERWITAKFYWQPGCAKGSSD